MSVHKKDVIRLLEKIALYLELQGANPFKISAYRRAAQSLERDERSLDEITDFTTIKGIGKGTNAVIVEYIQTNHSTTLANLEKEIPTGLIPLLQLPGLGGKRLAKLYQELNIEDADSLRKACESGEVEKIPGFGKKTAENILTALDEYQTRPPRLPIAYMLPIANEIEGYLDSIPEIVKYSRAGSLRRMKEYIKDLDFIIATDEPSKVKEAILAMDAIKQVIAAGETKVSVVRDDVYDVHIDFRLVNPEVFYTTLHHFTGSKEHNVAMRQLAKARGEKINEYGVEVEATNEILTFPSEKDFFAHFGLHYIPPEMRENSGEIELFTKEVPLISNEDIKGDLHVHTTWSDGAQSIEEMVQCARERGYEYVAITDHSKALRVANGLDETRLRRQREEIERIQQKYPDIHIFSGVEMDILPDGRLDFSNEFLREMDFVIASIHSAFNQSEDKIMKRLIKAMENPYVHMIAHPTGRLIGRRDGYEVNFEVLFNKAKETNTVLEINANPNRFDLSADLAKQAQDCGVLLAINTDAHSKQMYHHMEYGVSVAKKGWIREEQVINTWSLAELKELFNRHK